MKPASNRLPKLFPAAILASFLSSPRPGVRGYALLSLTLFIFLRPLFLSPFSLYSSHSLSPLISLLLSFLHLILSFCPPSGSLPSSVADLRGNRKSLSSWKPPVRHNLPSSCYKVTSLDHHEFPDWFRQFFCWLGVFDAGLDAGTAWHFLWSWLTKNILLVKLQ